MLGPSGCGKTTTLRLIAGFERPTRARSCSTATTCRGRPPHKRPVNTVFQSYALFPHMTVAENVAFGLRYQQGSKAERARRVGEAMALVRLGGLEARRPGQLSGGQQQRVALARALVLEPPVLLLDEPLGALDARLRVDLQVELKRIQEQLGITFIYVTHDQDEALTMSDRVAVMRGGRDRAVRRAARALRGARDGVRGQLPRLVEPDPGAQVDGGGARRRRLLAARRLRRPHRRRAGDDPARARAAGAARAPAARTACPGMVEEVVYLGFHQEVRVRLATGTLVACDVPNDGDGDRARAGRSGRRCTCRPELPAGACETDEAPATTLAGRRARGASSRRDGFAAATVGEITREAGAIAGAAELPLRLQGRGRRGGVRGAAREDLPTLEAISRRFEDPADRLAAYLDQSEWADARAGGCGSTRGASPFTPRACATRSGASTSAGGRCWPRCWPTACARAAGRAPTRRTRPRGWSR